MYSWQLAFRALNCHLMIRPLLSQLNHVVLSSNLLQFTRADTANFQSFLSGTRTRVPKLLFSSILHPSIGTKLLVEMRKGARGDYHRMPLIHPTKSPFISLHRFISPEFSLHRLGCLVSGTQFAESAWIGCLDVSKCHVCWLPIWYYTST